ncbi:MAG: cytochrome C oxidase subunit II, partial [Brevundimonas sp.]
MTRPAATEGMAGWPPPVLDPAGPFAGPVNVLAWVLFGMGAVVLAVVAVALVIALFGPRRWKQRLGGERLI